MASLLEAIKAFFVFLGLLKAAKAEIEKEAEEEKIDAAVKSGDTNKLDDLI